jgi:hypothetical protein
MFRQWVKRSMEQGALDVPYNSCGNGSAMRVGPIGWAFDTKIETLRMAEMSAQCTHNHPEGVKGAQAVALCIFMARNGSTKEEIRAAIQSEFGYNLDFTCDQIRPTYEWNGTCQGSVPQAIVAFLDGSDFEDCVRNAISIGGDSDTIGSITGSIAEAYYGIPQGVKEKAMSYLPAEFQEIIIEFENKYSKTDDSILQVQTRPKYTPERIHRLRPNEIFVFGSNLQGLHGGGAARAARKLFGAKMGQGVGLQGQSYAIPTMQGGVDTIRPYVNDFIEFARRNKHLTFYVTRIGCGIAGFRDEEIAPLFADAVDIENIILPETFVKNI